MKKLQIVICLFIVFLVTGCTGSKIESESVISEDTDFPELNFYEENSNSIEEIVELPRSYSYVEENQVPLVKNQEETNSCWAFAALTALESSKDEDVTGTYSVEHLVNHNPFENKFENGGAYVVTMSYLLSWKGPISVDENLSAENLKSDNLPAVHVQEIRQSEPKDYEAIKRYVYLYGGVESALYLDFHQSIDSSDCYNKETYAYCYQGEEKSNHDVVIVGWDDDYPAENFSGTVLNNGAFLCQNSWGEEFGDKGLFCVSYEDVNIGGYGVTYSRIDSADNYDILFQSDLCGYTAQIGYEQETAWFSNVYMTEESLLLKAAGFYATGKNTKYELYIVKDFIDTKSFADKHFICRGKFTDAGYYTVDFPEPYDIEAGDEFAIVIKIQTENAEYPVAVECPVSGLNENVDITDGKSYLSLQGKIWEHIEETKKYNICLKAYADKR